MSQLAGGGSQPKYGEELDCFLRRLETVRFQADGWQEPYESRGSRTDLWGTGGEIPPVYPTPKPSHTFPAGRSLAPAPHVHIPLSFSVSKSGQPFICGQNSKSKTDIRMKTDLQWLAINIVSIHL
jgi:hypothetical protein